jgi:hypothetical protein
MRRRLEILAQLRDRFLSTRAYSAAGLPSDPRGSGVSYPDDLTYCWDFNNTGQLGTARLRIA